jgi:hypothetical protein
VRGTRLAGRHPLSERLGESGCACWRGGRGGALQFTRVSGTTINAIAEFVLGRANLSQQHDRIERTILIAQPFLHVRGHLGMRQCTLIGRRREMIPFDHFSPFAALLLQLERRLEEVDVEPSRRIETAHHTGRLDAVEAAIANEAADDGTILLLDEGLIVLLVRRASV